MPCVPCANERSTFLAIGSRIIVMKKFLILFFILFSPNLFAGALEDEKELVKAVKKTNFST